MAFNPFDVFRRNQKILFAILTVFIMFMFTLSFGAGDFFTTFPRWLGAKRGTGDVLAVVDGSRVYYSELDDLRIRRELANRYMLVAALNAQSAIAKYVQDGAAKMSEEPRRALEEFVFVRQGGYVSPEMAQRLMIARQVPGYPAPSLEEQLASQETTLPRLQAILTLIATDPKTKPDDKDIADSALYLMELDFQLAEGGASRMYFVNQPNRTMRDALDFYLWLKKADDLGIRFTDADVNALIRDEFRGKVSDEGWQQALGEVRGTRAYADNPQNLLRALADEFRARAAQAAVLGSDLVRQPGPLAGGYDAPYSYYEFYKKLTSPARFGVLTVPAQAYLPAVQGQPTEGEIRDIFQKAKGVEPNPERPNVGLRRPRAIRVEWLEVTGNEPFYRDAAARQYPVREAFARDGGFFTIPLADPLTWAVTAVAPTRIPDALLQADYSREVARAERQIDMEWYLKPGNPWSNVSVADASLARPAVAAAAIGAGAGALATGAGWPTAGLVAEQAAATLDREGRAAALAALLAPPFDLADRLGSLAAHLAVTARPLAIEVVRENLIRTTKADLAHEVAAADLEAFRARIAELGAKADTAEVRAYVEEFVKERGLKTGGTPELRDQYAISDDPGLAPLKARLAGPQGDFPEDVQIGRLFFYDLLTGPDGRPTGGLTEGRGLYKATAYPNPSRLAPTENESVFLVWRVEDRPAENARDLNPETREKVLAGWRKLKARELAKKAAEDFAKQCETLGTDEAAIARNFLDKVEQFRGQLPDQSARPLAKDFEISNVAPLITAAAPIPGQYTVSAFRVTRTPEIPYPTPKMSEQLLAAREKSPPATAVMADQPEDRFYVAVLFGESPRSPGEFADAVYSPLSFGGQLRGAIRRRHQEEVVKQSRDLGVALLKAQFGVTKESPKLEDKTGSGDS